MNSDSQPQGKPVDVSPPVETIQATTKERPDKLSRIKNAMMRRDALSDDKENSHCQGPVNAPIVPPEVLSHSALERPALSEQNHNITPNQEKKPNLLSPVPRRIVDGASNLVDSAKATSPGPSPGRASERSQTCPPSSSTKGEEEIQSRDTQVLGSVELENGQRLIVVASDEMSSQRRRRRQLAATSPSDIKSPFAVIVQMMVEETHVNDPTIMRWEQDGNCFRVFPDHPDLPGVLAVHFQHRNYSSFQRQLNTYGWTKRRNGPYGGTFYHPAFHRNSTSSDLGNIQRGQKRSPWPGESEWKGIHSQNTPAARRKENGSSLNTSTRKPPPPKRVRGTTSVKKKKQSAGTSVGKSLERLQSLRHEYSNQNHSTQWYQSQEQTRLPLSFPDEELENPTSTPEKCQLIPGSLMRSELLTPTSNDSTNPSCPHQARQYTGNFISSPLAHMANWTPHHLKHRDNDREIDLVCTSDLSSYLYDALQKKTATSSHVTKENWSIASPAFSKVPTDSIGGLTPIIEAIGLEEPCNKLRFRPPQQDSHYRQNLLFSRQRHQLPNRFQVALARGHLAPFSPMFVRAIPSSQASSSEGTPFSQTDTPKISNPSVPHQIETCTVVPSNKGSGSPPTRHPLHPTPQHNVTPASPANLRSSLDQAAGSIYT